MREVGLISAGLAVVLGGCGASGPSGEPVDHDGVGAKADERVCAPIEHDTPARARVGEGQGDAWIDVSDVEPLPMPGGKPAWLTYEVWDASPGGVGAYWASAWAEDAPEDLELEVCQYFTCDRGDPVVAEGTCSTEAGDLVYDSEVEYEGEILPGCCVVGGNGAEVLLDDPGCAEPNHHSENMNGDVFVSVRQLSEPVCLRELFVGIDVYSF